MKPDEIRTAVQDMWHAFDVKDIDRFVGFCAQDIDVYDNLGLKLGSREEFKDYVRGWFEMSSDARVVVRRILVDGHEAAAELHLAGKHDGESLYGQQAAGAHVEIDWVILVTVNDDGMIQKLGIFFSPTGMLEQLGLGTSAPLRPA